MIRSGLILAGANHAWATGKPLKPGIAGAKYLIMSLWQVPDKQTSLLMTTFYKKWLEEKMTIPEAFRAAQKELREAGLDPYQWAGFVLVE